MEMRDSESELTSSHRLLFAPVITRINKDNPNEPYVEKLATGVKVVYPCKASPSQLSGPMSFASPSAGTLLHSYPQLCPANLGGRRHVDA